MLIIQNNVDSKGLEGYLWRCEMISYVWNRLAEEIKWRLWAAFSQMHNIMHKLLWMKDEIQHVLWHLGPAEVRSSVISSWDMAMRLKKYDSDVVFFAGLTAVFQTTCEYWNEGNIW